MADNTPKSPRTSDKVTPRCPICGAPDISGGPCQAGKKRKN